MNSPSRNVAIFLLIIGGVLFLTGARFIIDFNWIEESNRQVYGVAGGLTILVGTAILSARYPLDIWWYKRNPPTLEPKLIRLLDELFPFFRGLDFENKKKFSQKSSIFLLRTEIELINAESIPADVEVFIAASASLYQFHTKKEVFIDLEKVVLYPVQFPTPLHLQRHACEFHDDGIILLSLKEFTEGLANPAENFNIGTYAFGVAYIHFAKIEDTISPESISVLEEIRGISIDSIIAKFNIPNFNTTAFAYETYFYDAEEMNKKAPEIYQQIKDTFL